MNKLVTAIGCLVMLGAAIVPAAYAHGNSGAHPEPWTGTAGQPPAADTQPSGWYYGSVSAWAQLQDNPPPPALNPGGACPIAVNPAIDPALNAILCSALDPSFTLAAADALCDMEVAGTGGGDAVDEVQVDANGIGPGMAPDGTFNDGGIGAVCHTHAGYYSLAGYNTPGCPAGTATAEDAVVGTGVWISTSCDDSQPSATTPLLTIVLSGETCTANGVLTANVNTIVGCAENLSACLTGVPNPPGCPSTAAKICVPDGVSDSGNSGTGLGVPYPGQSAACSAVGGDSAAATFVWNSVQASLTGTTVTPTVLSTAAYGYVA